MKSIWEFIKKYWVAFILALLIFILTLGSKALKRIFGGEDS